MQSTFSYIIITVLFVLWARGSHAVAQSFENRKQSLPSQQPITPLQTQNGENVDELTLEQMQDYYQSQSSSKDPRDSSMIMLQFEQMAETMQQLHPGIFYSKQYDTTCYKVLLIEVDTSEFQSYAGIFRKNLCEETTPYFNCGGYSFLLSAFYLIVQEKNIKEAKQKVLSALPNKKVTLISLGDLDENLNKEYFQMPLPPNMEQMLLSYFRSGELNKKDLVKGINRRY